MDWEIVSFEGMGPIKFGMSPLDVAGILGSPARTRRGLRPSSFSEFRAELDPIIRYRDGAVTEIEAFYDVKNIRFNEINVFQEDGKTVLGKLQILNGGAMTSVGIVLFNRIGITAGRLDQEPRTDHSITAFAKNTWNSKIDKFLDISFL